MPAWHLFFSRGVYVPCLDHTLFIAQGSMQVVIRDGRYCNARAIVNIEFLEKTNVIPNPAFGDRALSELDSWKKRALINGDQASSFIMEMSEKPRARALLLSIFGNSQFLTQSLRQEPEILQSAVIIGLNETALKIISSLSQDDFWRQNSDKVSEKFPKIKNILILHRVF